MIRILILDDDELFVSTFARSLRNTHDLDIAPTTATTVEEAIRAIEQASEPFDVFLIDHLLGTGVDGIDVMRDFRRLSPQTEAIILTGNNDPVAGMLAYEAGAYRYLIKPIILRELVLVIRSFVYLRVMTQVVEAAQRAMSEREVADIVVNGALELGFERARLWILQDDSNLLVGISQAGEQAIEPFEHIRMEVDESPYTQDLLTQNEPQFFHGEDRGETYLHGHFAPAYKGPRGDWVVIPLWSDKRCQGILILDNADIERPIQQDQRTILRLFGRQVAAALERARLQAEDARKTRELQVLNEIGKYVANRATRVGMKRLLREVRNQLARVIDTRNFLVALRRHDDRQVEVCLEYENNQLRPQRDLPRRGLTPHLMDKNESLLLPTGSHDYRASHQIPLVGPPSRCWLGVPLAIDNRVIGAIVVQDYQQNGRFSPQDQRLLELVARQIAAPIEILQQKEQERDNGRRLAVLHNASESMLKLAQEHEQWLWHLVLTLATADYALQFNRAMLFLAEQNGQRFRGSLGIGQLTRAEAEASWERDRRERATFERYLRQRREGTLQPTSVEKRMEGILIDADGGDAFSMVLQRNRRLKVSAGRAQQRMPAAFLKQFGVADYAILPLQLQDKPFGVLVVDNVFNRSKLDKRLLEQLEQLLTQATLIYDNIHQRRARDQLITLNHTVLVQAEVQNLRQTLTEVCEAAIASVGADCAIILPCKHLPPAAEIAFAYEHTGAAGLAAGGHAGSDLPAEVLGALERGEVLEYIHESMPEWFTVAGAQTVFSRERIQALVCRPITDDASGQVVGGLLLGYRAQPNASSHDQFKIESFVRLANMAIRSTYARERLDQMIELSQERGKELERLRKVLQALSPSPDHKRMALALLTAVRELLGQADVRIGLLLRQWSNTTETDSPREQRRMFLLPPGSPQDPATLEQLVERCDDFLESGITGRVFQTGRSQLVPNVHAGEFAKLFFDVQMMTTQSELDVPIKLNGKVIGVFNVESSQLDAFTHAHRHILERLAGAAALALDNVSRQEHLRNVLDAAQVVIQPTAPQETLRAVLNAARKAAPDVSALTIWYREPITGSIRLGPYFGVNDPAGMEQSLPDATSIVAYVTQRDEPLWEIDVRNNKQMTRRFVGAEKIHSTAAFPLRTDNESVGALFFNYRETHSWNDEEKILFPIIATFAATSIRDALRLEATRKERDRLDAAIAITEAVGASLDLNETLHNILGHLRAQFHNATVGVLLYKADSERLEFTPPSLDYYNTGKLQQNSIPLAGKSIAARLARNALASGQVELLNEPDVANNADYLPAIKATCSQVSVTLMGNEKLLGVLVLEWPYRNAFNDDDSPLILSISRQISLAIERTYQKDELRVRTIVATHTAWAAEIAHDTNREISRIRQRAYLLKHTPQLNASVYAIAQDIDESAGRLADVANASNNASDETLAIDDWLRRWLPDMLSERGVATTLDLSGLNCPGILVSASAVVVGRAVRHLVRNAIEAMNSSGRLIVASRHRTDEFVEILISDTGPGVSEDVRLRLFADTVSTKGANGGMGLLYAQSAIRHIGGNITLLPQVEGQGASFVMLLPVATTQQEKDRTV